MKGLSRSFCLLVSLALLLLPAVGGGRASGAWSDPSVVWPEQWDDPLYVTMDDAGSRLTALIPYSGANDNNRSVVVTEKSGGAWGEPVAIATNGAWSAAPFQALPQATHPVISGDGGTIAYVGYTGTTFAVYISDRGASGWGAPAPLDTGLANHQAQHNVPLPTFVPRNRYGSEDDRELGIAFFSAMFKS